MEFFSAANIKAVDLSLVSLISYSGIKYLITAIEFDYAAHYRAVKFSLFFILISY